MSINLGILGLAHGHVGSYCDQWQRMPGAPVRLAVAWDHDAKRAASTREKYGCEIAPSPDALLRHPDLDAIVIGAETSLHADLVEAAADAGKRIILQKPMALTLDQADRIVAAVRREGVPFTLAWQMRVDPQNLEMKHLLLGGALGRVFMVRRRHGLGTHTWAGFEDSWHVKPELNRGMWADDAAHAIDFLLWLLGEPETVSAEVATLHNVRVPDDNGIAVFRYANGAIAEVCCSFTCLAGENTTEIVCERGVIVQNYGDAPSANAPRPHGAIGLKWIMQGDKHWSVSDVPSPVNHGERIAALAPELLKFLRGERGPIATAEEGRAALRMTLACYRSAELGRRVRISEVNA